MQKEVDQIVNWLQEQVKLAGVNGLLVGISGGIDSAVVAHLIKLACPDHSLGVLMPINTSEENMQDAKEVAASCGINTITVDLTEARASMYGNITKELKSSATYKEENAQLAKANLSARLRMSTLYTVATNHNYLVVGTDNAAEWYTGYFTKYGDGGVDILPIVEFTKGEVKELADNLGVPDSVLNKQPSADLWEGQSDEKEMGTTYAEIDALIKGESIPEKDKEIIEAMHKRTAHKRDPLPQFNRTI
ncbi:NAD(+) synthase [Virgibacillus salexigens]|uniref:NH(3)-dependent NAD(+) synthetase n=1 Tax=Virgibacillus kapii TaxID=1638645 RepID=A0ABQ2D7X7_9BACI|nr:NAD(+) synthase [Virgibacillus kapii]GGJ49245.1 NH(3)-dependent NAD(+) synthetase [Virgibacillus kapii]